VRRHAIAAGARVKSRGWRTTCSTGSRPTRLRRDPRGAGGGAAPRAVRRRAPEQVDEFLAEWVEPVLARYARGLRTGNPGTPCLRRGRSAGRGAARTATTSCARGAAGAASGARSRSAGAALLGPGDDDAAAGHGAARRADRRCSASWCTSGAPPRASASGSRVRGGPGARCRPAAAANLREIRRDYDRAVRLPTSLVREFAETTTLAQQAWREARERSDFAAFAPWLEKVVELTAARRSATAADGGEAYDALIDEYEPGARTAEIERCSASCAPADAADPRDRGVRPPPDDRLHRLRIPIERQAAFNRDRRGADRLRLRGRAAGHLHPPLLPGDRPGRHRLTTRYREDGFPTRSAPRCTRAGTGSTSRGCPRTEHLGSRSARRRASASTRASRGSGRTWSAARALLGVGAPPRAQERSARALDELDVDEVYRAMNRVEPNLIRVESDEATYNLHIMLRFDLERALLAATWRRGPARAWNERIARDLGARGARRPRGALQDVHWSMGAIGYFPTYTLGNLYAAQFWERHPRSAARPGRAIARGEFGDAARLAARERPPPRPPLHRARAVRAGHRPPLSAEPFMATWRASCAAVRRV
jgi:carboxypeptidase Taq